MNRAARSPLSDGELLWMLRDEPELLAIADALVETRSGRRARRRSARRPRHARRRFVVASLGALLALAAVAGVLGRSSSSHLSAGAPGIADPDDRTDGPAAPAHFLMQREL